MPANLVKIQNSINAEIKLSELVCQNFRHDVLGYAFWREIFEEPEKLEKVLPKSELGTGRKAGILDIWISVTTGHHGVPPKLKENLNNFTSQNKKDAFQYLEEALKLFPLAEIQFVLNKRRLGIGLSITPG